MTTHVIVQILAEAKADYGPLTPVVVTAGAIVSAVAALGLAWRGRANWEPAEEDLSRAPAKVSGLISAVLLVLLWVFVGKEGSRATLGWIAGVTGALTVISMFVYGFLIAVYVYDRVVSDMPETSKTIKIVGGFTLTSEAKAARIEDANRTTQDVLAGAAYNPDRVWPRWSRALMKAAFTLSYIGLTMLGTIALAAAAMLLLR